MNLEDCFLRYAGSEADETSDMGRWDKMFNVVRDYISDDRLGGKTTFRNYLNGGRIYLLRTLPDLHALLATA